MPTLPNNNLFAVGMNVFTTKEILIWGDYLLQKPIPLNTKGVIKSVSGNDPASAVYEVSFNKELPIFKIKHYNLR